VLKDALDKSGIMKPEKTEKTRESFFAYFDSCFSFETLIEGVEGDSTLIFMASKYYHVDTSVLHQANLADFDAFDKKLGNILPVIGDTYMNIAIVPGIILSSNSTEITGNTASWDVSSNSFYAKDYTLSVESKKINKGTVIVSGTLVVFLLIGLVAGMIRKK